MGDSGWEGERSPLDVCSVRCCAQQLGHRNTGGGNRFPPWKAVCCWLLSWSSALRRWYGVTGHRINYVWGMCLVGVAAKLFEDWMMLCSCLGCCRFRSDQCEVGFALSWWILIISLSCWCFCFDCRSYYLHIILCCHNSCLMDRSVFNCIEAVRPMFCFSGIRCVVRQQHHLGVCYGLKSWLYGKYGPLWQKRKEVIYGNAKLSLNKDECLFLWFIFPTIHLIESCWFSHPTKFAWPTFLPFFYTSVVAPIFLPSPQSGGIYVLERSSLVLFRSSSLHRHARVPNAKWKVAEQWGFDVVPKQSDKNGFFTSFFPLFFSALLEVQFPLFALSVSTPPFFCTLPFWSSV